MDHGAELRVRRFRIELPHVFRRRRPHDARQRLDGVEDAGDAAERQRRRAEPHDLLVLRLRVAADDLDRIGRRVFAVVRLVQLLESRTKIRLHQVH